MDFSAGCSITAVMLGLPDVRVLHSDYSSNRLSLTV